MRVGAVRTDHIGRTFPILLVVVFGRSLQGEATHLALEYNGRSKLRIQAFSRELAFQEFLFKNRPNAIVVDKSGSGLIGSHADIPHAVIDDPLALTRTIRKLCPRIAA